MKEFKGTPGPWILRSEIIQSVGTDEEMTAICYGAENANLIAAAPELLEALQDVLYELLVKKEVHEGTIENAESAIAKALGESK